MAINSANISAAGAASNVHGSALTVENPSAGNYTVKFKTEMATIPNIIAGYQGGGNNGLGVIVYEETKKQFKVEVRNTLNVNTNIAWAFIANG